MTKENGKDDGKDGHFGRMKNIAEIGDIILVAGYPFQEFQVESFSHNLDYQKEYVDEDIMYDAADIASGEYLLALQEDITVIVKAEKADDYIKGKSGRHSGETPKDWSVILADIDFTGIADGGKSGEATTGPTQDDRIDELLDELSDVNGLIELFGEHEDDDLQDRKYVLRKTEIEAKLIELTGGDR